jgi:hypothetical protein
MRFCHIKDTLMAGWVKLLHDKIEYIETSSSTQLEVSINFKQGYN